MDQTATPDSGAPPNAQRGDTSVKVMTGRQVSAALRERKLSQFDLARAAGLPGTSVGAVLRGEWKLKDERMARFENALAALELDQPAPIDPNDPVFTVRRAEPVESQPS
jgi:hypothetical protein